MSKKAIPNLDTFSAVVDRLIIEVLKLHDFEHLKAAEHKLPNPDPVKIAEWDLASRSACETRSALKNYLDQVFEKAVRDGDYTSLTEERNF